MKYKDIYVIVPAYNEEKVIKEIISNLLNKFSNVIVIDDGSTDGTLNEIKDFDVKIIHHEINLGVGAAVQTGFEYVSMIDSAHAVITFDADGQHLVKDAESMAKEAMISDADIIFGTRFPKFARNIPLVKRIILNLVFH